MISNVASKWENVRSNPTYWPGALDDTEGRTINWHSPADPTSSQIFCISAFGGLRHLPDADNILNSLLTNLVSETRHDWMIRLEYADRSVLGETGQGMPSNIDAFCESSGAVVCIEAKFLYDAYMGFGACGQIVKPKDKLKPNCAGFYGPGSDLKTESAANCRLEIKDRNRHPRNYWQLGQQYFRDNVYRVQVAGDKCPFGGSNFQLMRNFLFAASKAGSDRQFAVVVVVPEKTSHTVLTQVSAFRNTILRERFESRILVKTYEQLVSLLANSRHSESRDLALFLGERMETLL